MCLIIVLMPWSFSNPYFGVIEGVGGKGEHVDVGAGAYVGCLDLEVRTSVVYGFSRVLMAMIMKVEMIKAILQV